MLSKEEIPKIYVEIDAEGLPDFQKTAEDTTIPQKKSPSAPDGC